MEEEKKKKRNKKKKNKQSKAGEDVVVDAGETASLDQNHVSNGQDDHVQVCSETADGHNDVQNMNVGLNGHRPNGTDVSILVEAERPQGLNREATLEETIRQLRNENDLHASLEETVKVIQNKNVLHIKKEATLEETVKQLQNENNSYIQKEAGLEMMIVQLLSEKDSLLEKEAGLEEKISQLLDEKGNLTLKGASLEEKVKCLEEEKDIWILKENSTKGTIASLNGDVAKLHVQVVELEEFRRSLLQENQRLTEIISGLQSQIQNLERSISSTSSSDELKKHASEHEDLNSQMEAAHALVDKLITENALLIENVIKGVSLAFMVNELYVELDRHPTAGLSSASLSDQMVQAADTASVADTMSESNENLSVTGKKLELVEIVPVKVENIGSDNVDIEHAAAIPNSSVSDEPGEIVQISLDENEIRDLELQAANNDEKAAVPISDAPLIGAPFRLISFVAKYVSGADLVNKSSSH